ncbi:putative odorant receptor 83c [Anopheles ziemanni]|uniref:putative odorant receptor 83c n=1 Tax=Anopheles coustani TaxID=139045 RepID=UPI002659B6D4|nr:putative odorant receptor 83c [Anopheles coustani]XP_058169190.1 putative odorant receptor 83c [Anopheles ziemanni]
MEASNKFGQYMAYIRRLCRVLGFDVFNAEWKMNYRSYFSIFLCGLYLWWMLQSAITAEGTREPLKTLAFLGFFFQSTLKIYYTLSNHKNFYSTYYKLEQTIYDGHIGGTAEQKQVILRVITVILDLVKVTTVLYSFSVVMFSLYPAYMYFWEDTKVTIFPLHVPGINIYSLYGYSVTNMLHMLIAVYGLFGALASDTAFMMFVLHIVTYVELFRVECEKLEAELLASEWRERWHSVAYRKFCRQNMVFLYRFHQDIINYMDSLKVCYYQTCMVQVATSSFSIMFNLFLALTTDWYATYSFLAVSLFQLLIFCILGNVIQVMNDRLNQVILNLPWYLLPNGEQKRFLFMLYRSQLPADMDIRGFGPLNMETFTAIMQKIYSAFMMMYSFIEE